jgi:hypothetical protein
MRKVKFTFNPYQFIFSTLFLILGLVVIGKNSNWYVAIGVFLVAISLSVKFVMRQD